MSNITPRKTFGTHTAYLPQTRTMERLVHWQINPRHDLTAGGEEMRESLSAVGQLDDVHVWRCIDGEKILRGNRRVANMLALGWTECRQVVHEFSDERDAYAFLLEDRGFGHSMDLSAEEKILAVENGVHLGMTAGDLCAALGVSEDRAQLWFDLGETLPPVAREALHEGRLSMATAEVLMKVEDNEQRRKAAQMVLRDVNGEPMSPSLARNVIEVQFVLPEKWRKQWEVLVPKLKKKMLVGEGFHYVEWKERETYVQGTSGQPESEYEFAGAIRPRSAETWGAAAEQLGVPRYVCPAPQHVDGHVVLVCVKMVRDAEAVNLKTTDETDVDTDGTDFRRDEGLETRGLDNHPCDPSSSVASVEDLSEMPRLSDAERVEIRRVMSEIEQALLDTPTDAMGKGPWEAVMEYLVHQASGGAAMEAWKGFTTHDEVAAMVAGDRKIRWYLRQALLLILCAQCDAASDLESGMFILREVAKTLGCGGDDKLTHGGPTQ